MKKLFHFVLIILIVFSVTSCSKTINDLQPNEKTSVAAAQNTGTLRYINTGITTPPVFQLAPIIDQPVRIYPYILQPHSLQLGTAKESILHEGNSDYVVFFVQADREYIQPSTSATLRLVESTRGQIIDTYELISYEEAANYDITVPDDLAGKAYMFAIVRLDVLNRNSNKLITLYAEIGTGAINTAVGAKIDRAFVYIP